jgi:hypothetical protein
VLCVQVVVCLYYTPSSCLGFSLISVIVPLRAKLKTIGTATRPWYFEEFSNKRKNVCCCSAAADDDDDDKM